MADASTLRGGSTGLWASAVVINLQIGNSRQTHTGRRYGANKDPLPPWRLAPKARSII